MESGRFAGYFSKDNQRPRVYLKDLAGAIGVPELDLDYGAASRRPKRGNIEGFDIPQTRVAAATVLAKQRGWL